MNAKSLRNMVCSALAALIPVTGAMAAGTLSPAGSGEMPAEILSHDVKVLINNGFARTEVVQRFRNPNPGTVEAVYAFPLPKSASLSEVTVTVGEQLIEGEVVDKQTADKIYGEEKSKGNQAAKAEKDGYQEFRFAIANLAAGGEATIRFVYYQPLVVDTGVVSYVYPLEEGNTRDIAAESFWTGNSRLSGAPASMRVVVRSAWPLAAIRVPGRNPVGQKLDLAGGSAELEYELGGELGSDFVFHYQLAELPGRLEVIPYRAPGAKEGTFMMVLTPGIDLAPIASGADYVFVLDVSGSMSGEKLRTLGEGVAQAIGRMSGGDRFRIVTFSDSAKDLTGGWVAATAENVGGWCGRLRNLRPEGSTNLHAGLTAALRKIDADRVTSLVLVTDGVANTGEVDPRRFHELLKKQDIRVFGFLMGNSANWPLMRVICDASGGFYSGVSNSDDIVGQILKAKGKICFEALHDADVRIDGVRTADLTGDAVKKLYRGQQLVVFGRYTGSGEATVRFNVKLSGRDRTYSCRVNFPETDADSPELERLWAMSRVEMFEDLVNSGRMPEKEAASAIRDLGVGYQLVTDETSMLVLSDDAFRSYGIERRNRGRIAAEQAAQSRRAAAPVRNYRADVPAAGTSGENRNNLFESNAPRLGGGAVGPGMMLVILALAVAGARAGVFGRK